MADKGASNLSAVLDKFKSGQRATLKVQAEARQERDERLAAKPASAAPPGGHIERLLVRVWFTCCYSAVTYVNVSH